MTAELKAEIAGLTFDLSGKQTLSLTLHGDGRAVYDALHGKALSVTVKEYKEHRSRNANALCWALCTQIADVLRTSKEAVYLDMLKAYGQSEIVSVVSDIDLTGYVKYCEVAGTSELNGKPFTHYKVYKGSSEYDTREMSIFLDGIVQEAKDMGIPVLTESELALLKEEWH